MDPRLETLHERIQRSMREQFNTAQRLDHLRYPEEFSEIYADLDAGFARVKEYLDEARKINALGPFPFLRLPEEIQLMIYDLHFREYNTHVIFDHPSMEESAHAGIHLLSVSKKVYADALPRLVRNATFKMWVDGYKDDDNGFDFADRLSFVSPKIANLIKNLELEIVLDLDSIGWITMDWTGLKTMENLKVLNVEMRLRDELQMAWCVAHYERSVALRSLVEGLIRALPAACELNWADNAAYDGKGIWLFCPPDLTSLRERINPYRARSPALLGAAKS